jgi:radical SAM protein with 4Fe4S-binding SPASM domain
MCLRSVRSFDGPDMEFDLFKKVVDDGIPHLQYLSLDGPGETTMNPDAFRMVRYARDNGVRVMFSTNATLLDGVMSEAVLDCGVDLIIFSVNGASPEVYHSVHRRACYEEVLANIHRFLALKRKRKAPVLVYIQMIRLRETVPQMGAFYRRWRNVAGIDAVRVKKDVVCNKSVCCEESPRRTTRRNPCSRLWHGPLFVETDGSVYASPGVLYKAGPIGNVKERSLSEIWNGEEMRAMRRSHIRGDVSGLPECVDCAYLQPRLPLIIAGFLVDPFTAGKLVPVAEKLAFWYRLPLFQKIGLS